jgi:hypothetical protein
LGLDTNMAGAAAVDVEKLRAYLREEWRNPGKRQANLKLLLALGVFTGGVVVARFYGEALFVS